jgi:hypothetical protein
LDLSAPRVPDRTAALLALSEAAIVLVESAGKIQTRMFIGRAHATAPAKTKQGPDQRFCRCFSGFPLAFPRARGILRNTKDRAVHAQTGKLCRLQGSCERRKKP